MAVMQVDHAIISERVIITDHEVLIVSLVGRIGHDAGMYMIRGTESGEYREAKRHLVTMLPHLRPIFSTGEASDDEGRPPAAAAG